MKATLVYKTDNEYINLFKSKLEFLDYSCHHDEKNEERLRNIFSIEIEDKEGEFKILIDPKDIPLKEIVFHKDMNDFNHLKELNVRFDCSEKEEFINRIAKMMLESDEVLDGLYERFEDELDHNKKMEYLMSKVSDKKEVRLRILGTFIEDRFKDKESYLFVRELEEFCRNVYDKEKENKIIIRG